MSEYETFLCIYATVGAMFTIHEHWRYEFDFSELPTFVIVLNIIQQLIHYTRYILTWPLYLMEDVVVFASNWTYEEEDEDGNDEE